MALPGRRNGEDGMPETITGSQSLGIPSGSTRVSLVPRQKLPDCTPLVHCWVVARVVPGLVTMIGSDSVMSWVTVST